MAATLLSLYFAVPCVIVITLTDSVNQTTAVTINPETPSRFSADIDLPIEVFNLTCECRDLRNINCSWVNGPDRVITANNIPVLKISDGRFCNDLKINADPVDCKHQNQSSAGKLQHCFFNIGQYWYYNGFCLQIYSNNQPIPDAKIFSFIMDKEAIPLPPTELTVKNFNQSSLQFTWVTPEGWSGNNGDLRYQAQYGKSESKIKKSKNTGKKTGVLLDNLQSYTNYCVSVRVRNIFHKDGKWSEWSSDTCHRTSEGVPASPKNLSCDVISTSANNKAKKNVSISWTAIAKRNWNGELVGYSVEVCPNTDHRCLVFNVTQEKTRLVKDLEVNQTYKITVRAYNAAQMSLKSVPCSLIVEADISPTDVSSNHSSYKVHALAFGSLLFAVIIVVSCSLCSRYYLKKQVTSNIKGSIRIPETGIVGPLTFKKIEDETYTQAVQADPRVAVTHVSDEDGNFAASNPFKPPGIDEGYVSLHPSLECNDSLLTESNDLKGNDYDSNEPQHNPSSKINLNYIEVYSQNDDDDDSVFEGLLSKPDILGEQTSDVCSTHPNDLCKINGDEIFRGKFNTIITTIGANFESDMNVSHAEYPAPANDQVLPSLTGAALTASDTGNVSAKSETQIMAPISESTMKADNTNIAPYVKLSDPFLSSPSVTFAMCTHSPTKVTNGNHIVDIQPKWSTSSSPSSSCAFSQNNLSSQLSVEASTNHAGNSKSTASTAITDYVKQDQIPLVLFSAKTSVKTALTGPVLKPSACGEMEQCVQQSFV